MWIESHQSVGAHPKTRKIARRLGISVPTVVGHLHLLWHWALSYAPQGNLTSHSSEDIAIGAQWEGDPDEFMGALVACGFADVDGDETYLHDWFDYAGKLIERRRRDAQRKASARREQGGSEDVHGIRPLRPQDGVGTHPTEPTGPISTTTDPLPPEGEDGDGFRKATEALSRSVHPDALAYAVAEARPRWEAGEIRSPIGYLKKKAADWEQRNMQGPKRALLDGVLHELDAGTSMWNPCSRQDGPPA